MTDDAEDNFLIWLLEHSAVSPNDRAVVFIEVTPPPWIDGKIHRDSHHAQLVPTELLARAAKEGLIEVSGQPSVEQKIRMQRALAGFLKNCGIHDAGNTSASRAAFDKFCRPEVREFERFVSLTGYGLQAAHLAENRHEERRKVAGRSRGNQVRAALLCWLYDNPYNVEAVVATYIISTTTRPRVNNIPVSRSELIHAENVLRQQGLIALVADGIYIGRVRLTALGVQCVEEYAGDWTEMSEDKNRPKSTIQIGVLGTVTGGNLAIQSEGVISQETSPLSGAGSAESEIRRLVAQIQQLSARHAEQLDKPEQVKRDAADLAEEMKRPGEDRDKDRIKDTLTRLATRVSSVSVLTDSVKKLWGLLFG